MAIKFIDLFSGAGGLSLGLKNCGFESVLANDIDQNFCETYKKNNPLVNVSCFDIAREELKPVFEKFKGVDLVVGGPPCQGFSQKGNRQGLKDERNYLFKKFLDVVRITDPKVVLMENVPNLLSTSNGYFKSQIVSYFEKLNYRCSYKILNAYDYGVPQKRKRAFIIASRTKKDFIFPVPVKYNVNVFDAISDLPKLNSGEGDFFIEYSLSPISNFQKKMRIDSKGIYNHIATNHSKMALYKLSFIPKLGDKNHLPMELRTKSLHSGTWSRIDPSKPSRTITTRFDTPSSGQFTLNDQNRCLTVREAARLQSFPDKYIFFGNKTSQMKQVGNAVPPELAKNLGLKLEELF